jgi:hypothetical protein
MRIIHYAIRRITRIGRMICIEQCWLIRCGPITYKFLRDLLCTFASRMLD